MWTPLNNADVVAQEIVRLAQRDQEYAANRILMLIDEVLSNKKFRKWLYERPRAEAEADQQEPPKL